MTSSISAAQIVGDTLYLDLEGVIGDPVLRRMADCIRELTPTVDRNIARVTVLPADVKRALPPPIDSRRPRTSARRSSAVAPQPSGAIGHGLVDAVRAINEGAAILAEARSNGAGDT